MKIKSDERKAQEKYVADVYHVSQNDREKHDIVEMVSARSTEAYDSLKHQESRKYF